MRKQKKQEFNASDTVVDPELDFGDIIQNWNLGGAISVFSCKKFLNTIVY